ncbi:FixH family protein [Sphingorhabdus arenilitoris]|uniref:FixH family protein n=1 Tax=Sphingorhabdus arenilitoris TaxID=1490041 RepID=A0ABV8REU7_9SPHN
MTPKRSPTEIGRFNGRHMTMILIVFFGIIMAVNFTMARLAVTGFSGTVVDNSYVASQNFNSWLNAADAQEKLGWTVQVKRRVDGRLQVEVSDRSGPLSAAKLSAVAVHPLGQKQSVSIDFEPSTQGDFLSSRPLPLGRWQLALTITKAGQSAHILKDLR